MPAKRGQNNIAPTERSIHLKTLRYLLLRARQHFRRVDVLPPGGPDIDR
jgi:hypothetical protein